MHAEIQHFRTFGSFGEVIFGIAGDGIDVKTLHHGRAARTVLIEKVIDGTRIAFFPDIGINKAFANEFLVGNFGNHEFTRREKANDVVNFRTIANRLVLFETVADKAFFVIHV